MDESPTNSSISSESIEKQSKSQITKKQKVKKFFRKYFLEGQKIDEPDSTVVDHQFHNEGNFSRSEIPFHERYRKYIGFGLPVLFMNTVWLILAIRYNVFRLYPTRYELPITMIFGSTIAGATSEGGGAIAFPVMTLLLHIEPKIARDFSLMCQSCGMTSAAFTIIWMKLVIEWHSVIFCSLGSSLSLVLWVQFMDDFLDGPSKKMFFVSFWFASAISLFILNTQRKRITHSSIQNFNTWKAIVLFCTGLFGGICTAIAGAGVCVCSFFILTLLFRVSEKVATPTSILLMAGNTVVGFFWRQLIMTDVSELAWDYFEVSVPVAVLCAPLGAFLASHFHRQTLAFLVYLLETLALIGFLITKPRLNLILIGAGIIVFSFFFFLALTKLGQMLEENRLGKKEKLKQNMNGVIEEGAKWSHFTDTNDIQKITNK